MEQWVASAMHHGTPSALVKGRVSQAEEYLKGSSVLTIQKREKYQGLSFPEQKLVSGCYGDFLRMMSMMLCTSQRETTVKILIPP